MQKLCSYCHEKNKPKRVKLTKSMFLQHQILVTMTQINILRKPLCSDEQMNTKNNQKEDAPSKLKSRELISV